MKYFVILAMGLGAVTLFLLSTASANTALFARQYPLLLALNAGLVLVLMVLVGYQLWELRRKLRAGVFGSKLTLRLVVFFSLISILPGVLVYGVSVQFLSKSIESWFDVRVDKALEGGLSLGRTALDNLLRELTKKADGLALTLAEQAPGNPLPILSRFTENSEVQEATLFDQHGKVIVFSSTEQTLVFPELPDPSVLRQVRMQKSYRVIESIPGKGLFLRVVVPVNVLSAREDIRVLQLLQPVPKQLAQDAETVQGVYRDYQELSLSRLGLKRLYGLTLTLSLLLALFSALALAFLISERLSAPLGILAEGTRAVAQGDFSRRQPVQSRDELGILTQSFNVMTEQLAEARAAAERNQRQVESAKAYLESILANLSSGVLVFDNELKLRTANPSASQILEVNLTEAEGSGLQEWDEGLPARHLFGGEIRQAFATQGEAEWQRQVERAAKGGNQVLLVRGTRLPAMTGGYVVVFDDITDLIQAQRAAAWREVARRLAHEIKNPLTPIQLSAERLEHKLAEKLNPQDTEILRRATRTIVNQVAALKSMVNAFSEYARLPELNLRQLDFNHLVREVLALYDTPDSHITLQLAAELPPVLGDQALLRQVIHNLLQNAQDALAEAKSPAIVVRTETANDAVKLSISDNGGGFPEQVKARAFEPYVTTKPKGTGLGLAIVKKIVEEHSGRIQIENLEPHGACVSITLPMAKAA